MKWERFEAWLFDTRTLGGSFTHDDVREHFRCSGRDATQLIQSYLMAQRAPGSRTLYVIHREGRTKGAIWSVGVRTVDARALSHQFFDDVQVRWLRAVEPDLVAIERLNPRARPKCERIIRAVGENAMQLLRIAVEGIADDEEE